MGKKENKNIDITKTADDTASMVDDLISQYRDTKIPLSKGKTKYELIDTGNYALNYILSGDFDRGMPVKGHICEIYGDSGSGKSLLCYYLAANFLKEYSDGVVILDDAEGAYVDYLGSEIELDDRRLIRVSSSTVECHANRIFLGGPVLVQTNDEDSNVVLSKKRDASGKSTTVRNYKEVIVEQPLVQELYGKGIKNIMVILDSVAVLSTRHEFLVGLEKIDMSKAKMLRAFMRNLMDSVRKFKATYIVTNHLVFNIKQGVASFFGPDKVPTGGTSLGFQSCVRLCTVPGGKIKDDGTKVVLGLKALVTTDKNRIAPPFRRTTLNIMFDSGISRYSGIIDLLKNLDVISSGAGGWYTVKGTNLKFQEKQLPDRWEEIKSQLMKSVLVRDKDKVKE